MGSGFKAFSSLLHDFSLLQVSAHKASEDLQSFLWYNPVLLSSGLWLGPRELMIVFATSVGLWLMWSYSLMTVRLWSPVPEAQSELPWWSMKMVEGDRQPWLHIWSCPWLAVQLCLSCFNLTVPAASSSKWICLLVCCQIYDEMIYVKGVTFRHCKKLLKWTGKGDVIFTKLTFIPGV